MSTGETQAQREGGSGPGELPLARALVALPPEIFETLQRAVAALFRVSRLPAFQARADRATSAPSDRAVEPSLERAPGATALHRDPESRQKHEEMGFYEGWGKALDQLVEMAKGM